MIAQQFFIFFLNMENFILIFNVREDWKILKNVNVPLFYTFKYKK